MLGRELFTPDEVRKLDNKKCIVFIRGFDPIMDNKYVPFRHPAFDQTADGKGAPYVHFPEGKGNTGSNAYKILTPKALAYYESLKDKGENVYIDSISYEDLKIMTELDMKKRFLSLDEKAQREKLNREQDNELQYAPEPVERSTKEKEAEPKQEKRKLSGEDTIMNRMAQWRYTKEQKEELHKMMALGMTREEILAVFYPETDVAKMQEVRRTYRAVKNMAG